MSRRRNPFRIALLVVLLLLPGAIALTLNTEAGLQWTLRILQNRVDGLAIESASGRLAGPFVLQGIRWSGGGHEVTLRQATVEWQPTQLLWQGRIRIDRLALDGLRVHLGETDAETTAERRDESGFRLPLATEIARFELADAHVIPHVNQGTDEPWAIERLGMRLHGSGERISIDELELLAERPRGRLTGKARLPLDGRGAIAVEASIDGELADHHLIADVTASGNTGDLGFTVHSRSPLVAELEGRAGLDGEQRWQATARLNTFPLARLLPDAPPLQVGDTVIEAEGAATVFSARVTSALEEDRFGAWTLEFAGSWDGARWSLARLRASERDGVGRITARARQSGAAPTELTGEVQWQHLAWQDLRSESGRLHLRGSPQAYAYEVTTSIDWRELPALELAASGSGDLQGTRIPELSGKWLDGTLAGNAQLAWETGFEGRLNLELQDLDPGGLHPDLAGRFSTRLELVTDRDDDARPRYSARIEDLRGRIAELPLHGQAHIVLDGEDRGTAAVDLGAGGAALRGTARFGPEWHADWRLQMPELATLVPGLHGELKLRGNHRGPPHTLRSRIDLQARNLVRGESSAATLQGQLEFTLDDVPHWNLRLEATEARTGAVELGRIDARSEGTLDAHTVILQTRHDTLHFDQRLRGSGSTTGWEGVLEDGRLVQVDVGTWSQRSPAAVRLAADRAFALERLCWDSTGAALCAAFESAGSEPRYHAELEWSELELGRLSTLVPLDGVDLSGISSGHVTASMDTSGVHAAITATARDGLLRHPLPGNAGLQTLRYSEARLDAVANEAGAEGTASLTLGDPSGAITASLHLPGYTLPRIPEADQAVRLALDADIALDADSLFIPNLHLGEGGRAHVDLGLSGTVGEPQLDGTVTATIGRLSLLPLGSQLDELRVNAQIRDNTIALSGGGRMGDGNLVIGGNGRFRSAADWEATFSLSGQELAAVRIPTAQITASPDIALQVTPGELRFNGSLTIPKAKLEPIRPESAITASDDVLVLGERQASERDALHLRGQLELILGEEVRVAGRGFEGRLTGRMVLTAARDNLSAQGEIAFVDGRYRAYGQNLSIRQGRVLYAGGPVDNPAIDVIASRTRGDNDEIEVGVRVLGTAKVPTIELYSSPAMDDADVLSWLIIGRPLSEARAGEGTDLYQAATSVAIAGGGALAEMIGERFNLVEVSIEAGEQTEDTALVLGRALSPRLYVRYIQGLMEDNNAIQFRYKLGEKWTLETESGSRTGAGADLLYSLER